MLLYDMVGSIRKFAFRTLFLGAYNVRTFKRRLIKKTSLAIRRLLIVSTAAVVVFFMVSGTAILDNLHMPTTYSPQQFSHLLDTIARGESQGNYNAYYANAGNSSLLFTEMTVAEILAWQEQHVAEGSPSSAVGKYQIIRPTLLLLIDRMQLDTNTKFDSAMQDMMAVELLERRGVNDFLANKISREQFAHNLSMEWAALPKGTGPNPTASYYDGDGLNKSQISLDEVYAAIDSLNNLRA